MALPAWVFLVVGVLVAFVSNRLGDRFVLFFWVGLLMLIYGLFRVILGYVLKNPSKVEDRATERRLNLQQIMACPNCATSCYSSARFCHNCGGRLR